jgi:hypothetical protein
MSDEPEPTEAEQLDHLRRICWCILDASENGTPEDLSDVLADLDFYLTEIYPREGDPEDRGRSTATLNPEMLAGLFDPDAGTVKVLLSDKPKDDRE